MKNRTHQSKIKYHFVTITPAEASELLGSLADRQRRLKVPHVEYLARQIISGEWNEDTAEPIKITERGKVIDGQHRLAAIVRAGQAVKAHVAMNVPESVMGTLDTGVSRSPADQARYLGVTHARDTAAVVRKIITLRARMSGHAVDHGRITASEMAAHINELGDSLAESIKMIPRSAAVCSPRPVFRAVFVLASQEAPAPTREFFEQLVSGVGLVEGDPALTLRHWLERRIAMGRHGSTPDAKLVAIVLIRTLNAFFDGREIRKISYRKDGPFPKIDACDQGALPSIADLRRRGSNP